MPALSAKAYMDMTVDQKDFEVLTQIDKIRKKNSTIKKRKHLKFLFALSLLTILCCVGIWAAVSSRVKHIAPPVTAEKGTPATGNTSYETTEIAKTDSSLSVADAPPETAPPPIAVSVKDQKKSKAEKVSTRRAAKTTHQGINVVKSVVCSDVNQRNPVGKRSVFSLGKDSCFIVWMDVKSKKYPIGIKHIYYHNGKIAHEVHLRLKYSRTRTWSKINLRGKSQVGSWKVNIATEDGKVLSQVRFEVTS